MPARCRSAVIALLALSCAPTPVIASGSPSPSTAAVPSMTAAVTSVAGPGYCAGAARRDATSATVRALAVDSAGDVFFDTGPPAAGLVARVGADGSVSTLSTGVPSGRPSHAVGAGQALVPTPGRLAADGTGGVLVAAGARVIDVDESNALTTVAGDPSAIGDVDGGGSAGDGGPATNARFARAASIATDAAGNLFIADVSSAHAVVRFINRGATSITFFGGTPGAVTVGPDRIGTIAGAASQRATAEPGATSAAALAASLPATAPVMTVVGDRLYIAVAAPDPRLARVLLVDLGSAPVSGEGVSVAPGQIIAVAGAGSGPTQAGAFPVATVTGLAATGDGRLYMAEESRHRVLQADASGNLGVTAGRPGGAQSDAGFDGDGHPAAGTRLNKPFDVKLGGGRVYIADQANDEVRAVDSDGVIRAVGGGGVATRWACSGGSTGVGLFGSPGAPTGVAVDESGVVYMALPALNRVQRIDLAGVVTTVAGGGPRAAGCQRDASCAGFSGDGGRATDALLDRPTALALGSGGDLYILDAGNARVRSVNLTDHSIEGLGITVGHGDIATVAGSGTPGFTGDGGSATRARILGAPAYARRADSIMAQVSDPRSYSLGSLAVGRDGNLFLAGGAGHTVRRIDASGRITSVTTAADAVSGRCCADPVALASDPAGDLFIADRGTDDAGALHPRVWLMNRTGRARTVLGVPVPRDAIISVAGDGAFGSDGDGGPAVQASLEVPIAVATDPNGGLYVAEAGVSTGGGVLLSDVRGVDAAGRITTVIGGGGVTFNGDGLPPLLTDLNLPSGVVADRCGNLLIADTGNDRVRRALLAGACPPIGNAAAQPGGQPLALVLVLVVLIGMITLVAVATTIWMRARRRRRRVRPPEGISNGGR